MVATPYWRLVRTEQRCQQIGLLNAGERDRIWGMRTIVAVEHGTLARMSISYGFSLALL